MVAVLDREEEDKTDAAASRMLSTRVRQAVSDGDIVGRDGAIGLYRVGAGGTVRHLVARQGVCVASIPEDFP